jgi:hypothetical protein
VNEKNCSIVVSHKHFTKQIDGFRHGFTIKAIKPVAPQTIMWLVPAERRSLKLR